MRYDGQDLSHLFKVESVGRSVLPPVEVNQTTIGGRDGSVFGSTALGALEIEVRVRLIAPRAVGIEAQRQSFDALRRRVAVSLYRDHLCELVLDDAPDVYYMAVLSGDTDIERFAETGGATLTFLCPESIAHGHTFTRKAHNGGTQRVNVGGSYPTAPVLTCACNGSPVSATFDGKPFRTVRAASGTLVVDAVSHTCEVDGSPVPVNIEDDYPSWEPGIHEVSCSLPYEVVWEERWL